MNKIVSSKITSAIFLAIVLVTGTIALTGPTFIVEEAQATSDHDNHYDNDDDNKKSYDNDRDNDKSREHDKGYDDDYDKSYGKDNRDKSKKDSSSSINIKKVKCNNINVNLNGVDFDKETSNDNAPINSAIAEAQAADDDEEQESNSFESDSGGSYDGRDVQSGSDTDYRIVCINNNNNIVVEETEPPEPPTCIECFSENLDEDQLRSLNVTLQSLTRANLNVQCESLTSSPFPDEEKFSTFLLAFRVAGITDEDTISDILECLEESGLITLPPDFELPSGGDRPNR